MSGMNPFSNGAPNSLINFCNREDELRQLIHHSQNGINTILLGIRRIGKSSLIHQLFNQLEDFSNQKCIYADINHTNNFEEFTNEIYKSVLTVFPKLKPDNFDFITSKKTTQALHTIFELLDKLNVKILIAIDEFQQITAYPNENTLSELQQSIQKLKNINFIFSCSNEYALNDLAGDENLAFFANSDLVQLQAIKERTYAKFITEHFVKKQQTISDEAVDFILAWTRCHTFYTQTLCKRIFNLQLNAIEIEDVHEECGQILQENESNYAIFRNLLSPVQWLLLKAIAKEEKVYHPTAKDFVLQHKIGTPANVQRALDALLTKEMVFAARDEQGRYYQVYDSFLSRWLESLD